MTDTMTGVRVLAAMAIERDWPTFREPDNADRSAMAAETLCYFARQTGLARSDESVDTIMCGSDYRYQAIQKILYQQS
ncbi:hypothetical protein A9798_12410 [Edwardsiella hoshinae]|uniref:Uncharacterized protein n=2 Tax=Edwardsiella hoshinae TaxID=93378 RepID=A0ABN4SZQ8_9GAMM|nr:hypothetical protein A9798_12410 [Edwardsiella hoshinae]